MSAPAATATEQANTVTISDAGPSRKKVSISVPAATVTAKLKEYRAWGVRHAWMVDPQAQKLYILEGDTLHQVESYEVPEYGLRISAAEIFR